MAATYSQAEKWLIIAGAWVGVMLAMMVVCALLYRRLTRKWTAEAARANDNRATLPALPRQVSHKYQATNSGFEKISAAELLGADLQFSTAEQQEIWRQLAEVEEDSPETEEERQAAAQKAALIAQQLAVKEEDVPEVLRPVQPSAEASYMEVQRLPKNAGYLQVQDSSPTKPRAPEPVPDLPNAAPREEFGFQKAMQQNNYSSSSESDDSDSESEDERPAYRPAAKPAAAQSQECTFLGNCTCPKCR